MNQPLAYLVEEIGEVVYYHQCFTQPDASKYVKAIVKDIYGHVDNKNWELVDRSTVPKGVKVIPSVRSMRCKEDLLTNQVTKYKAHLNLHGGKQELGVYY